MNLIKVPYAIAKINENDYYVSGNIKFDSFARLNGDFDFFNLDNIFYPAPAIKSIIGNTDQGLHFNIENPFSPNMIIPGNSHNVIINKISFIGNTSLTPNYFICEFKNSRTHFSGEINFGNEKYSLDSYSSNSRTRNKGKIGTRLIIEDSKYNIDEIESIIDAICDLLSICQRTPVTIASVTRFSNNDYVSGEAYRSTDDHEPVFPMTSTLNADEICVFLSKTLPSYLKNKTDYNLHLLTHYYSRSFNEYFNEHKFILASIFMEAFKYNWAKNFSSYYQVVDPSGVVNGFKRNRTDRFKISFEDLLCEAANHIGYSVKDYSFIENRNFIFHTGLPRHSHINDLKSEEALWDHLLKIYHDIDGILLKLLDYSGYIKTLNPPSYSRKF